MKKNGYSFELKYKYFFLKSYTLLYYRNVGTALHDKGFNYTNIA